MNKISYNQEYLSDWLWEKIEPYIPPHVKATNRGRPTCDLRKAMEGIIWILKTGARWRDLPNEYPSDSTCWRRLKELEEAGVWQQIWQFYLGALKKEKKLQAEEAYLDASFVRGKKGGTKSATPSWATAWTTGAL